MTPTTPINPTNRPLLLVSVRNAAEARAALSGGGGADIIDVKEPSRGPLGMADLDVIRAVIDAAPATPVTAALGDISDTTPTRGHAWALPVAYLKLGLANAPRDWRDILGAFDPARFVPVAYADHARAAAPPPKDILRWAIDHRCAAVLIDTAVKDGSNLFAHLDPAPLVAAARAANLAIALAGSLQGEAFNRAVALRPDIVAVRGAACLRGDRAGVVDAALVRTLREAINASTGNSAARSAQLSATLV